MSNDTPYDTHMMYPYGTPRIWPNGTPGAYPHGTPSILLAYPFKDKVSVAVCCSCCVVGFVVVVKVMGWV